jgi:Retrotransposon gag protein
MGTVATTSATPGRTKHEARLAREPPDFDGNKEEYDGWKRKIKLYLYAYRKDFPDDEAKCLFVLSYMKGGTAEQWANLFTDNLLAGSNQYPDQDKLWDTLDDRFSDSQKQYTTQTAYANLTQGTMKAEEFFMRFDLCRLQLGYMSELENKDKGNDARLIADLEERVRPALLKRIADKEKVPGTYEDFRREVIRFENQEVRWKRRYERPLTTQTLRHDKPVSTQPISAEYKPGTIGPMALDQARREGKCRHCREAWTYGHTCERRTAAQTAYKNRVPGMPTVQRREARSETPVVTEEVAAQLMDTVELMRKQLETLEKKVEEVKDEEH